MLLRPPVREHLLPLMDGLLHEFLRCTGFQELASDRKNTSPESG